jgi:hypothetical protein
LKYPVTVTNSGTFSELFFCSIEKVWLGSETFSQDHKKVSKVVCERQQITVTSIHWLYCEITETERIVGQFSEIPKLEVVFHIYILVSFNMKSYQLVHMGHCCNNMDSRFTPLFRKLNLPLLIC